MSTQTIEQTGKIWKAAALIGIILMIGAIWYLPLFLIGAALTLIAVVGGWWFHG